MPPHTEERVIAWMDRQDPRGIWTSAVTVYEARFGVSRLPDGARRQRLATSLDILLGTVLGGRVAPLDAATATRAAEIAAIREQQGIVIEDGDTFIAAIAEVHGATIATRNVKHFPGLSVPVIDPWTA